MGGMGKPTGDQQTWVYRTGTDTWQAGSTGGSGGGGITGYPNANFAFVTSSNVWNMPAGTTMVGEPNLTGSIVTTGSPVLVQVNINHTAMTAGAVGVFSLARNGVNLGHPLYGMQVSGPLVQTYNNNCSFWYVDFPPAGTYSYSVIGCSPTGSSAATQFGVGPASLMLFEMKNANVVTASSMLQQPVGGNLLYLSASIFVNRGPVLALASINYSNDGAGGWAWGTVARDGTNLGASFGIPLAVGATALECQNFSQAVLDFGASTGATHTYTVQTTNGAGTGVISRNNQLATLILWELTDVNYKYSTTQNNTSLGSGYTDIGLASPPLTMVTRGRPVWLLAAMQVNTSAASGRSAFSFLRNGQSVTSASKGLQLVDGENNNDWNKVPTMGWLDVVGPGTYQYQVAGYNVSGSSFMEQGPSLLTFFMYELDPGVQNGLTFGGWLDAGNKLLTTASVQIGGNLTVGGSLIVTGNYGSYATRGAAGNAGRRFIANDTQVAEWIDDGTKWRPFIMGQCLGYEPPLTGTFSGFNQGGATTTQFSGSFRYTGTNDGSTTTLRGFTQSFSSTTAFVEACIAPIPNPTAATNTYSIHGIVMRESGTDKSYVLSVNVIHGSTAVDAAYMTFNGSTNRVVNADIAQGYVNAPLFLRIRRDATNIYGDWSRDGLVWDNVDSRSLTSVFTTAPDSVGVAGFGFNVVPRANFLSYRTGSL